MIVIFECVKRYDQNVPKMEDNNNCIDYITHTKMQSRIYQFTLYYIKKMLKYVENNLQQNLSKSFY